MTHFLPLRSRSFLVQNSLGFKGKNENFLEHSFVTQSSSVYFYSEFSITVWCKLEKLGPFIHTKGDHENSNTQPRWPCAQNHPWLQSAGFHHLQHKHNRPSLCLCVPPLLLSPAESMQEGLFNASCKPSKVWFMWLAPLPDNVTFEIRWMHRACMPAFLVHRERAHSIYRTAISF